MIQDSYILLLTFNKIGMTFLFGYLVVILTTFISLECLDWLKSIYSYLCFVVLLQFPVAIYYIYYAYDIVEPFFLRVPTI